MAEVIGLAELVDQMPELGGVPKPPPAPVETAATTKPVKPPKPRNFGDAKLTGPPVWEDAQKIYDAILAGGRDSIVALIGMLGEGNDPGHYKPRYVLHDLIIYTCRPGKEQQRSMLMQELAARLGQAASKSVQAYLIRELEVAGAEAAAPALGKFLLDEELGDAAVRSLVAIRAGAPQQLRAALPNATGKRRLAIVQAMHALADAASAPALIAAAGDGDANVRLAAIWGLARIGGAGVVDVLIKASDTQGWERVKSTQACLLAAENLIAAGQKADAARIYKHLRDTRSDPSEHYIRDLAERALAG